MKHVCTGCKVGYRVSHENSEGEELNEKKYFSAALRFFNQ